MGLVRPTQPCIVRHPESGALMVPQPAETYRDDDPLVEAYPWLFASDADLEAGVEQATRAPGEKRQMRRR
jgi:hypothetical protein